MKRLMIILITLILFTAILVFFYMPGKGKDEINVERVSRFGINFANTFIDYDYELGENLHVRQWLYYDDFGWKHVKHEGLINECLDCSRDWDNPCKVGNFYYCEPGNREPLSDIQVPNHLLTVYASRYDDNPPEGTKDLISTYPYGHEDEYKAYVRYLVNGYKNEVKYWQIQNEADVNMFWVGTLQEYADLVKLASPEIKSICPECKVGLSFAGTEPLKEMDIIEGICEYFDFVDLHYPGSKGNRSVDADLAVWENTCPGKEYIPTESGIPSLLRSWENPPGGTEEAQAKEIIKYYTGLFDSGFHRVYTMYMDQNTDEGWDNMGLVTLSGQKKLAYNSYKTMIEKLDYFTSINKLAEGQYKYTFTDKRPVYVLWCDSGKCSIPDEITGQVTVTDYLGNEETKDASEIVLTGSPIFVE